VCIAKRGGFIPSFRKLEGVMFLKDARKVKGQNERGGGGPGRKSPPKNFPGSKGNNSM